jgi:hypothetical protein
VAQEEGTGADPSGPASPGEEGGDPPTEGPPLPGTGEGDPSIPAPTEREDTPSSAQPADPSPPEPAGPAGGVVLGVGASDARAVLIRQFRWQDDTGGDPGPTVHRAVRDTTQAVWRMPGLSAADSALAAHIMGLSLIALGDSLRGVDWLDEAVRVDPLDRYILVRDAHRRSP